MAVQRRNIFGATYGTAKMEHGKAHAPKMAPQTQAPVPLAFGAGQQLPPELSGSPGAPQPPQAQAQGQGQQQGQGSGPLDPKMEQLLQQLLSQFGGQRG